MAKKKDESEEQSYEDFYRHPLQDAADDADKDKGTKKEKESESPGS